AQHKRVDKPGGTLPSAADLEDETIHSRSVTLSSERYRVIAKMDVIEAAAGVVTPVDYKHGKPRENLGGLELWPPDRVQLAVQGLVLRENGYSCDEGVVYYFGTKQRVRVVFDDAVMAEAARAIESAWETARAGTIPPPLVDSPKCPGCSLVSICLPDEVTRLLRPEPDAVQLALFTAGEDSAPRKPAQKEMRALVTPRDDLKPVYLNTPGLRVGKSGAVLQVKDREKTFRRSGSLRSASST
ncbi:MAG: CRISPR-associated protein Cas4, partial [Bryobacteraceae bacterium]